MAEKKLILIIVEGSTDERALSGVLRKTVDSSAFSFQYVRGNIFTDEKYLIKNMVQALDEVVDDFLTRNSQFRDKIDCVIQITDTDGCFLQPQYVEQGGEETVYGEDKIITPYREEINKRNINASSKIYKMANLGTYRDKPYYLLYLSREQEHVLHNEIKKLSQDEKGSLANAFRKQYMGHETDFKKFICNSSFAVPGTYADTWQFIKNGNNSLKRYSNLHLIYSLTEQLA